MKTKINVLSNDEIIKLLNESNSLREVLTKIGYSTNGSGGYKIFKNECKKRNIDIPKYEYNGDGKIGKRIPNEKVFCKNSTYSRQHLKRRIIKENLIEYKCSECNLVGEWNDKPISLQLEHKNGINDDNRLENLTFLCPNCHSQTDSFAGKSKKKYHYCECGNQRTKRNKWCKKCSTDNRGIEQRKTERPIYEILLKEIEEFGYTGTGRKYGVSDNAIRKWKKFYEK